MKYTIEMEEYILNNLKLFLERTTMSGKEVAAYAEILKCLSEAKPKEVGDE